MTLMTLSPAERAAGVRAEIRARRLRDHFFDGLELGDPRWEMLQDLEAATLEGYARPVSVSSLCLASMAPQATALRHLVAMEGEGWICSVPHPADRRSRYLRLTPRSLAALRLYRAHVGYGVQWQQDPMELLALEQNPGAKAEHILAQIRALLA